jgi:hypothetical protein
VVKKILLLLALVLIPTLAHAQTSGLFAPSTWHLVQPPTQLSAQSASIASTTLYTTPAAGYYRICMNEELTRAATTSSTLPTMGIVYTSGIDSANKFYVLLGSGVVNNTNQTFNAGGGCSAPFFAAASTAIQYNALNYASSGATTMQYDLTISLETE